MHRMKQILCFLLVFSLLILPAGAADDNENFRENRPPTPYQIGPQWVETEIAILSGDNTLRGTMTCPKDLPETMPVAILLHGLNTDRHWCDDIAWCLADNGIASVRFDFDGNGLSDGAQQDMTISSEVQDVLAMLDYVERLRFTDPDNIFLVGKSMGGVAAVLAAQGRSDEIKAMCLWYPGFGCAINAHFGYFLGKWFMPWDPPETLEVAGYTYGREFLLEVANMDFTEAVESYDGPVLILHGDRDYITPLFHSLWAAHTFPDCTLHVVPGGGHGFFLMQELFSLEDMLSFIEDNLTQKAA